MKIINPATEELLATVEPDTRESLQEKFEFLQAGQRQWAAQGIATRLEAIKKFDLLLEEEAPRLAHTLTSEMGKPLQQSFNELAGARTRIRYFIDNAASYLADEWVVQEGGTREKIVYEPLGVIANISAWNYPYLVGVNVFIPALLGGNAVMYKPSEYATLTGLHIRDLLYRSGVPTSVFQVAVGDGETGALLTEFPFNGYYFTGSNRTGKVLAEKVAPKLVPLQLELGGKDPLYVMEDVSDLNTTAANVAEGVLYNNGQSCCAVERVYVHEKIYDDFVEAFLLATRKMVLGDPLEKETEIGPLARKEQREFLLSQVTDAVAKGARIAAGGDIIDGKGYFIQPTVLLNVDHSMRIMKEESFGPVIGIQKVQDDAEAIALMQDTEYGLTAAVYSTDYERAEKVFRQMNTGSVYWNCCDRVSASLPWSGRKASGLGSTLSYQGIRAFVQPKAYHLRD